MRGDLFVNALKLAEHVFKLLAKVVDVVGGSVFSPFFCL